MVKECLRFLKIKESSTWFIAMCSSTLLKKNFSSLSIIFSWPDVSSLNLLTTYSSCNKMCCDESTSTPIAYVIIFLAFSIIENSLSLSALNYFYLVFCSKSWLTSLISSTMVVSRSNFGITISLSRSMSSLVSLQVSRSFKGFFGSTSDLTSLDL